MVTVVGIGQGALPDGGAAVRTPASAWYALAILIAVALFAFVDRQILNLIAPSLQTTLHLSDLQLGALQGLSLSLFAGVASYPIGWLADRFGRRRVLGCCVVLWSASTAACALQSSFAGLFAATAGIAIGESALAPIVFALIPDLFPERRRNAANIIFFAAAMLGAAAGFGLGGAALGWLAEHQQSLPGVFATMDAWRVALIIVASPAPLFVLLLGGVRTRRATAHSVGGEGSYSLARMSPFMRQHWPVFACLYGMIAAYSLPVQSAYVWLPIAIPRIFGTSSSTIGLQLGAATGIATIVGLLLPSLIGRFLPGAATLKPLRLVRIFPVVAILPTLLLLTASAPWQIYAAADSQLALGLATAALMPGLLQQVSPPDLRVRLLAILGMVTAVAQGVSPLLVGALSVEFQGPRGVLVAIVIVGLSGWVFAAILATAARPPFLKTTAAVM